MQSKQSKQIRTMVLAGLFLALGLLLPLLTGQIPQIGSKLLPMHIPVLLCGFVCGWPWGLLVGLVTPVFRSLIFGMPPMVPTAIAMSAELAAYGAATGLLYLFLPKRMPWYYVNLAIAMLVGRILWGVVSIPLYMASAKAFSWAIFWASGFVNAIPGIVLQFVIIPPIVHALQRAKVMSVSDPA
ncbi:MAG TPA: ECF transporter S component [Clostridia bacterium]|nr:ECF transporter S component [Clostridia bacterium]